MKKILALSLTIVALGAITFAKIYAAKKNSPKLTAQMRKPAAANCYKDHWEDGTIKDCISPTRDCLCPVVVKPKKIDDFNVAINNNTVSNFFSDPDNLSTFGIDANSAEAQELTASSTTVFEQYNQNTGKYYYSVCSAANPTFDEDDFIIQVVPDQQ